MNRMLVLGALAAILVGCGQNGLPGMRAATVEEPLTVASQPAPTIIYEVRQAAPAPAPTVVNTVTSSAVVEAQPAAERNVVVVHERTRTRYRTHYRPGRPLVVIRPVLPRLLFPRPRPPAHPPRYRTPPRSSPPRPPARPPGRRAGPPRERERPSPGRGGRGRG